MISTYEMQLEGYTHDWLIQENRGIGCWCMGGVPGQIWLRGGSVQLCESPTGCATPTYQIGPGGSLKAQIAVYSEIPSMLETSAIKVQNVLLRSGHSALSFRHPIIYLYIFNL